MSDAANAFRAGLVIIAGTVIAVVFYLSSEKTSFARNSVDYFAYLTDAGGINAKSIMGVMMLAAGQGAKLELEASGEDEQACVDALVERIHNRFDEEE